MGMVLREGEVAPMVASVDFAEWVAVRGPGLLRLAYVLTGSAGEAEEIVQEALSRALPRWTRIVSLDNPDAYVRRMIVNAHTSAWRRFRRREVPVPVLPDRPVDVLTGIAADERSRLWQACLRLPSDQRVAVALRYYEQLEYAEIAALTGVREGTVRSRVSRGLAALREDMGATGGEHDD